MYNHGALYNHGTINLGTITSETIPVSDNLMYTCIDVLAGIHVSSYQVQDNVPKTCVTSPVEVCILLSFTKAGPVQAHTQAQCMTNVRKTVSVILLV